MGKHFLVPCLSASEHSSVCGRINHIKVVLCHFTAPRLSWWSLLLVAMWFALAHALTVGTMQALFSSPTLNRARVRGYLLHSIVDTFIMVIMYDAPFLQKLCFAASNGNIDELVPLLMSGININVTYEVWWRSLNLAYMCKCLILNLY